MLPPSYICLAAAALFVSQAAANFADSCRDIQFEFDGGASRKAFVSAHCRRGDEGGGGGGEVWTGLELNDCIVNRGGRMQWGARFVLVLTFSTHVGGFWRCVSSKGSVRLSYEGMSKWYGSGQFTDSCSLCVTSGTKMTCMCKGPHSVEKSTIDVGMFSPLTRCH
jgi:hypothetical protein